LVDWFSFPAKVRVSRKTAKEKRKEKPQKVAKAKFMLQRSGFHFSLKGHADGANDHADNAVNTHSLSEIPTTAKKYREK